MSDKSFEWQNELQEVVHSPDAPNTSSKVAHLRDTLTARLRIMTPADHDERVAIKRALSVLSAARPKN
jgi:prephenate dehydrogenase